MPDSTTAPAAETALVHARSAGRFRAAWPELVLVAWTLFVWLGRIRNVAADPDLSGSARAWSLGMAVTLSLLAVVTLVAVATRTLADPIARGAALTLAAASSAIWVVRAIGIAGNEHSAGFIAVHLVLAAVTLALSALVARHLLRSVPAG